MNLDIPYIRVGTSYFKIIEKPLISGDKVKVMTRWNRETIVSDHGKSFLERILKLDGFCCIPDHQNFQLIVENFYNTYNELTVLPTNEELSLEHLENSIPNTMNFVHHIFGDQKEFGL